MNPSPFSLRFVLYSILAFSLVFTACRSKKNLERKRHQANVEKPSKKIISKYAEEMEVPKSKIKNKKLYAFINDWEGTRYAFGGLNKRGIDCSGLVYLLYKNVYDEQIPRTTAGQVQNIRRKYESHLKEGDLVFFDYDGKKFSHVGVYLQNGYYVHASTSKGVMVAKLHDPYTYKYFSRCGSLKK